MNDHIHLVTGKLAEPMLRRVLEQLPDATRRTCSVQVLPITVAALMTTKWIRRHLELPESTSRVVLPGYTSGPLEPLAAEFGVPFERGPRDLHQLPEFLGEAPAPIEYGDYSIEILAEINHAPRLDPKTLVQTALSLREAGADIIDIGCEPEGGWTGVGDAVRRLRDAGLRVSIDSFDPAEIAPAVRAGAELVLSVQRQNREQAADWGCPVVVIPDLPGDLESLDDNIAYLARRDVPLRIDPIVEPIGCGFAASLQRYLQVRARYPDAEMLMGIGNLTEMTDVDSAGVNVLLLGFCQELQIRSVLTTQVINWARSAVAECHAARQLVHFAARHRTPPKHLDARLVMLRDTATRDIAPAALDELAKAIRDHHVRLFADDRQLHAVIRGHHLADDNPMQLFQKLLAVYPRPLDPAHAFYLGYELAKATTAQTLGKRYEQDEPLDWGLLTRPEAKRK